MCSEDLIRIEQADDVARFICLYGKEIVKHCDIAGNSSLHFARSSAVAKVLVNAIVETERNDFLLVKNKNGLTALHSASMQGRADVITYLLSHQAVSQTLLTAKDLDGNTALHYAANMQAAAFLLREASSKQHLIKILNNNGESPLHTASQNGRDDVLQYIISKIEIDKKSLLAMNEAGNTPLHLAKSIAAVKPLLEACKSELGGEYLSCFKMLNKNGQNMMHTISFEQNEVELLLYVMREISPQIGDRIDHLLAPDKDGNTPLLLSIGHDKGDFAKKMLENCDSDTAKQLLTHRNLAEQNVYHIASQQISSRELLDILTFYQDDDDFEDIMKPDKNGNSPLNYLAGSYNVKHFSKQVFSLSLCRRRELMFNTNDSNVHCRSIAEREECPQHELKEFFRHNVLNDRTNRNLHSFYGDMMDTWQWLLIRKSFTLNYDPRLRCTLHYAALEYPLPEKRIKRACIHPISNYSPSKHLIKQQVGRKLRYVWYFVLWTIS